MGLEMIHQGYVPSSAQELIVVERQLLTVQRGMDFKDVAPHLTDSGKGKLSVPYKAVRHFAPKAFEDDAQKEGDCTSHGSRNAADISRAYEILIRGEAEEWIARGATEGIYGYRGHSGEGMSPAKATEFLHKFGILLRQKYPFADLSKYNNLIGHNWGGSSLPQAVRDEAAKHPCKYFARIKSVEEARDALANGLGLHIGSQYGNNGVRDAKGVSDWNATFNHDMCVGACDDTGVYKEMVFLILNSWGVWNKGGMPDWGPIPGGSFLVYASVLQRMIQSGECWAVGDVTGWPAKDIIDFGFGSFL